eukprot:2187341-Alexandrium_andersonii.AAC.1
MAQSSHLAYVGGPVAEKNTPSCSSGALRPRSISCPPCLQHSRWRTSSATPESKRADTSGVADPCTLSEGS